MSGIPLTPLVTVHRPLMLVAPNSHVKTRGFDSHLPGLNKLCLGLSAILCALYFGPLLNCARVVWCTNESNGS